MTHRYSFEDCPVCRARGYADSTVHRQANAAPLDKHAVLAELKRLNAEVRCKASEIVDARTRRYMAEHNLSSKDYSSAMRRVLDADPELKKIYAGV